MPSILGKEMAVVLSQKLRFWQAIIQFWQLLIAASKKLV